MKKEIKVSKKVAKKVIKKDVENQIKNQIIDKNPKPNVELSEGDKLKIQEANGLVQVVTKIVVADVKKDMNISIKNHFDAMRNNVINEIKDIRTMIEQGKQLEQPHIDPDVAIPPSKNPLVNGENNNQTRTNPPVQKIQQQQQQNTVANTAIDPQVVSKLLEFLPELLKSRQQPQTDPQMDMIKQLMMKKFVNDMSRSDTKDSAMTDFLLKLIIKRDPDILNNTQSLIPEGD